MKPIFMTKETEENILKSFFTKFQKEWENFKNNMNETKFTFSTTISQEAKEKVTVLYSQEAYLKMMFLVDYYDSEVAWYGLVDKLEDKLYYVYDIKICKQYVTGGKVDTEDEDTLDFFNSLTDEEADHMHFQAHSHVKMSTNASGVDLQNQTDVIRNMGKTGFYIFQIWNKTGDINTYLYDLDNNVFYDKKDVVLEVQDGDKTISTFLEETEKLVQEKKVPQFTKTDNKKKETYEPSYLPGYYNEYNYNGRWDW